MQKKKRTKTQKTRKVKSGEHGPEKLDIDPTLKPTVVDTSHMASKEEQADNPLGRVKKSFTEERGYEIKNSLKYRKPLPEGFKTADQVTEVDDLKFELGRLREMLSAFLDKITIDGKVYNVLVDPINRVVEITRNNAV